MTNYVNREDIDSLFKEVNNIKRNLESMGVSDISGLLSNYYDQSEIDVPLNNLKTNLGSLETQLTSLSSELDDLSFDLFGDDTTKGLQDYLNDLQVMIYGKGNSYVDDKGVTHTCTINDPCPESLKGRLGKLAIDLSGLSDDTAYLKDTLLVLSTYLTNFQGTLAQFKAKLAEHNIDYDELDTGITVLLEKIFVAQGAIGSVETRVGLVEDDIGNPTDSKAQGDNTVYGYLNDTSDLATETDGKVEDISNEEGTGSLDIVKTRVDGITNDDEDGVLDIVVDTTIPAVKDKMGFSEIPSGENLQGQLTVVQGDVGTVNPNRDGDLQTQIGELITKIYEELFCCEIVSSITERNNLNARFVKACYVEEEGKFYKYTGDDILGG